jgi:23S rRNA maturation mini-RNase III
MNEVGALVRSAYEDCPFHKLMTSMVTKMASSSGHLDRIVTCDVLPESEATWTRRGRQSSTSEKRIEARRSPEHLQGEDY